MSSQQLELFPTERPSPPPALPKPDLREDNRLADAYGPFTEYMHQREFAENTIKSFLNDLALLDEFLGPKVTLGEINAGTLQEFVQHLLYERDAPCSPKSLERRITTLKVFFGWLAESEVLPNDPAATLIHRPAQSPLPQILSDAQVEALLAITSGMRDAPEAPDARPHLLVSLVLGTAIKKSECLRIRLDQIALAGPTESTVYIHYDKPRQRLKSRRLLLPEDFARTLEAYNRRYQPKVHLFECTARNLEYVLHTLSTLANLPFKLTFETLRYTSAVRSLKEGMAEERLRKRLGLSQIAWRDTLPLLRRLAEQPL